MKNVEDKPKGKKTKKATPTPPVPRDAPELRIVPRRQGLRLGHENRMEVLVRIPCPPPPEGRVRPTLNVAYVLDRSGSMDGRPLDQAKRCVAAMAAQMGPTDHAALVVYDDKVRVVVPSRTVSSPEIFAAALAGIESGGSTDLHGGWLAGAREVTKHQQDTGVNRVILLSDGNANCGLTDVAAIEEQCRALAGAGVTTSTYGLGNAFNEDLMIRMARSGAGSGYYGESADDLMEPFRTEFDLMSALMGRGVRLEVTPGPGVTVRVLNDYLPVGSNHWLLPDLAWGGETWALVEVECLPPLTCVAGHPVKVLQVTASWTDLEGKARQSSPAALDLPLLQMGWEDLPEDEMVVRRAGELAAAEYQRRAHEAAGRGAWKEVEALLRQAKAQAADNPWVAGVLDALREIAALKDVMAFQKQAAYASRQMSTRIADAQGEEACYSPAAEASRPSFSRRKTWQGRTQFEDPKDSSTKN